MKPEGRQGESPSCSPRLRPLSCKAGNGQNGGMNIQSLSVVVPGRCVNACKFCVSKLHHEEYVDQLEKNLRFRDLYERDFMERLQFARDNGCNTLILTGDGEPVVNKDFLNDFAVWNAMIKDPFRWIEVQTSGVTLDDEKLRWLRNKVRVTTVSLSLSDVFDSDANQACNGTPEKLKVDIDRLCAEIKRYDFNLRLSLNLTDAYADRRVEDIFARCRALGADQVTFRVLYDVDSSVSPEVHAWIGEHRLEAGKVEEIHRHIREKGRKLEKLPFGAMRWSVDGMSCVLDDDCMSTREDTDVIRYLILRANCKLYTKWDDRGSVLF